MLKNLSSGLVAIMTLSLFACGDELSEEDTQKAFVAMNTALAAGVAGAQYPNGLTADQTTLDFDFTYNCSQGGTLDLDGSGEYGTSGITFDLTTAFSQCREQNIEMDGTLTYSYEITSDPITFVYTFQGDMSFSGDVTGDCAIDFVMTGTLTSSYTYTFSGTICGYEASGTLSYSGG